MILKPSALCFVVSFEVCVSSGGKSVELKAQEGVEPPSEPREEPSGDLLMVAIFTVPLLTHWLFVHTFTCLQGLHRLRRSAIVSQFGATFAGFLYSHSTILMPLRSVTFLLASGEASGGPRSSSCCWASGSVYARCLETKALCLVFSLVRATYRRWSP